MDGARSLTAGIGDCKATLTARTAELPVSPQQPMGSADGALLRWLSQVLGYGDSLGTVLVDELTFADHAGRRDMEFARTLAVKVRVGGQPLFCAATRRPQSIPPC